MTGPDTKPRDRSAAPFSALPPLVTRGVLAVVVALILIATLTPTGTEIEPEFMRCIVCGQYGISDALVNIVLFAPLGFALALVGRTGWRPVLYAALFSSTIELAQLVIPGRDSSIGDVCFNTLGAVVGQLALSAARRWLIPSDAAAARLSLLAGTLAALCLGASGWLMSPFYPPAPYHLWTTPDSPDYVWYDARVLRASIGSQRLHARDTVPGARDLLMAGAPVSLVALAGSDAPALGALIVFRARHGREVFLVGPDRDDLVLRYRTQSQRVGLYQPDLRVHGALQDVGQGDTLRITARREADGYCLALNDSETCHLGYRIGDGWKLFWYPKHLRLWVQRLLSWGWIAGLAAPVGWWGRRRLATVAAVALLAAGVLFLPHAVGLLTSTPAEVGAAVAGILIGLILRTLVSARAGPLASGR